MFRGNAVSNHFCIRVCLSLYFSIIYCRYVGISKGFHHKAEVIDVGRGTQETCSNITICLIDLWWHNLLQLCSSLCMIVSSYVVLVGNDYGFVSRADIGSLSFVQHYNRLDIMPGKQFSDVLTDSTLGHSYYYNAATKKSTYVRPVVAPILPPVQIVPHPVDPSRSFLQYQSIPDVGTGGFGDGSLRDGQIHLRNQGGIRHGREDIHHQHKPRGPQPTDKPKSQREIPGCSPWVLVQTKLGRRFVYNPDKGQSYWRIPDKLKAGILELDQLRFREKAGIAESPSEQSNEASGAAERPGAPSRTNAPLEVADHEGANESSEYEEVEVTDDEAEDGAEELATKRQKTEEAMAEEPVEFDEDDIAFQLAAMGQDYGLEPGEYDDGNMEEWEEGAEGLELSAEDAAALFTDLLNDFNINPYSPWEKLIDEGRLIDDARYTALPNMKARKEVWEIWSKDKIQEVKAKRAKEEKRDPRIPFMAFLQKNANPKLYWPEFKRKFKKEAEMRDSGLSDRDREKWYREYINRLKLPTSQLKTEFLALVKTLPLSKLNNQSSTNDLPAELLVDMRFVALDPQIRDPLLDSYIDTLLPPLTSDQQRQVETEDQKKQRLDKERREKALRDREEKVEEQKRKQQKQLAFGKGRLREEEMEIQRAMNVGKKGLMGHLAEE